MWLRSYNVSIKVVSLSNCYFCYNLTQVFCHTQYFYLNCIAKIVIPTFHWTTFPLRSWRSRSFSKIIPNRSRSVDSHTIWGLHASSTFPLRFCYASVTLLPRCSRFGCVVIVLLLRSRYDNEDPATLRVR